MWFARPGRGWILGSLLLALILASGGAYARSLPLLVGALALAAVTVFLGAFFRDPERRSLRPGVLAAADGRILSVTEEGDRIRVATFMNISNVHVNRVPLPGRLISVEDRGGPKRPAFSPAAAGNSQKRYLLETPLGPVEVIQITGLLARRCISYHPPGRTYRRGERFGMIAFGSRVDVVLPRARVHVHCRVGDIVRAGETVIAEEVP